MIMIIQLRPEIYKGIEAFAPIKLLKTSYSLARKNMTELHQGLKIAMEEKRLFLNQDLTLKDLSVELNSNTTYVSQTINGMSKKSFFDFVNTYRVEYAKQLLLDDRYSKYSIEGIGKESGFRSRSAFYNAFRKNCQMSPLEYKNQNAL